MAITNKDRISRTLDLLREGLVPFVEREFHARMGEDWKRKFNDTRMYPLDRNARWDTHGLLKAMLDNWMSVFKHVLGNAERAYVSEMADVRNKFAHENPFSSEDTLRALDTARRLLESISAKDKADEVQKLALELQRTIYSEQSRQQTRSKTLTLEGQPTSGLKPWREIITPHKDVASGKYQQAEFAADLAQVHHGDASAEYGDPVEFYRRTYLTEGLKDLVKGAMVRLSKKGGEPVMELQTNFGGGKTHSMLALYHLAKAKDPRVLPGVEPLMTEVGLQTLPACKVAVLVGTDLSPGQPLTKPDGTVVKTFWGEMAWQLGGKKAFELVAQADATGTNPGGALKTLFEKYSPCLVLIDEWVAYVRQLYGVDGLPAGSFDANLTFAQALSEQAKAVPGVLVVASLPASDIEIGGDGGRAALARLQNTFKRIDRPWRPASSDEGFEIVRRRLFEPITDKDHFAARDVVVKAFTDLYRSNTGEFPHGSGEGDYRRRMEAAYPIHPELFERLYNDWGSLDRFQRTRGVLRLMAAVIHALWERNDSGLLILPASVPLDNLVVEAELTKYLSEGWPSVISHDIDGPTSVALEIDRQLPTLGRYSATRRVARTLFMGSAPTSSQGRNPGIDDRRIKIGCAQPGETPATFGDALRRLADRSTYLYQDNARYWFSTQPSVSRIADDRAAQLNEHDIEQKIVDLLRQDRNKGEFAGVHRAPDGSIEVDDELDTRLVVLSPEHSHTARAAESPAFKAAAEILERRGTAPRVYRNALAFLAADGQRLIELRQSVRLFMAWSSICHDHETLNLDAHQRRQAETKRDELKSTVASRILETWIWAIYPRQDDPKAKIYEWASEKVKGDDPLAVRASKSLTQVEALFVEERQGRPGLGPGRLSMELEKVWSDAPHLGTRKLWEFLASYLYLPRLANSHVLANAIQAGLADLANDRFAYADRYDEAQRRYAGLKLHGPGTVVVDSLSVLVKSAAAREQLALPPATPTVAGTPTQPGPGGPPTGSPTTASPTPQRLPTRFFANVEINPERAVRDIGNVVNEVLQHLTTLPGAQARVSLEIEVKVPHGVSSETQRVVTENCKTLKIDTHGFEEK